MTRHWCDSSAERRQALLQLLADGQFHSGADLGARLGVSRAAVHKQIAALAELGIDCHAVQGRGYRLAQALQPLQPQQWQPPLDKGAVALTIDSTNGALMRERRQLPTGYVLLAEHQSAGRGRRGRGWVSPPATNLYLSLLWRFDQGLEAVLGLSQAVALACLDALQTEGADGLRLKWPNDLLWQGRKLGGILIELAGQPGEPTDVVIGVGLNLQMSDLDAAAIDQPWVDLTTVLGRRPERNRVAATLVSVLRAELGRFECEGLGPRLPQWRQHDAFGQQPVRLLLGPQRVVSGIVAGIDHQGALLLQTDSGIERFLGGEVSLRGVSP
ncbi:MAG: bifunctional biotin--[Gammaproteobacteria bacterium]|nr:bifunctional biotin--[acetyl-CoA-carboxylase] ligase/biotin operon repressor BirA [Gammaproteobacteria bacterium]